MGKGLSANKQRMIGFVVAGLQILVSTLSGLLFTPFMISSLGQVEYGLYQLLYSAIGYVAVLDLGLGSTVVRYIIKYDSDETRDKQKSVVSMCLMLYFVISAIAMLAVFGVSFFLKNMFVSTITDANLAKARLLFILMGVSSCLSLFDHAFMGILNAYEKYTVTKGVRIFRDIFRIALLIVLFKMGVDSLAIVLVDLSLMALITIVDLISSKRLMRFSFFTKKIDVPLLKSILSFSLFAFLQVIVSQVNISIDRLVLGRYSTLVIVGMYGVAMQLYNMFSSFGNLFGGLTLPMVTRAVYQGGDRNQISDMCAKHSRIQCYILLLVLSGFTLFGREFIGFWLDGEYDAFQLWAIILLITAPNIIEWIETPIFNVMKAKNLQKMRSLILIGVMVVHVILAVIFVKYEIFGVFGAAIATSISFVLGNNILSNIYYHKMVGINMIRYVIKLCKGILPAWILSMGVGYAISLLPGGSIWMFLAKCVLFTAVYGLLMLFLGTNAQERAMLKSRVKKKK